MFKYTYIFVYLHAYIYIHVYTHTHAQFCMHLRHIARNANNEIHVQSQSHIWAVGRRGGGGGGVRAAGELGGWIFSRHVLAVLCLHCFMIYECMIL